MKFKLITGTLNAAPSRGLHFEYPVRNIYLLTSPNVDASKHPSVAVSKRNQIFTKSILWVYTRLVNCDYLP